MYIVTVEMKQPDCPFVLTSEDVEVTYFSPFWDFREKNLFGRIYITGKNCEVIQTSIEMLELQPNLLEFELLSRDAKAVLAKIRMGITNAMDIVRKNNGYIVGPFFIRKGWEIWQIGFDKKEYIENTIRDLEMSPNEFKIKNQNNLTIDQFSKVICNASQIAGLINTLENITKEEKDIVNALVAYGFYDDPRKISLSELAKKFGLTAAGMSKKLRKIEKKVIGSVIPLIDLNQGEFSSDFSELKLSNLKK